MGKLVGAIVAAIMRIFLYTLIGFLIFVAILPLIAVPASLSLPGGQRPGVEPLSLDQAAEQLRQGDTEGWELVEQARSLVGERMQYSRRNSLQWAPAAFSRGYGYCQQTAYALAGLLEKLGFEAQVVSAMQNRFPDDHISGHAWVRVQLDGEVREIDPVFFDAASGELLFTPVSEVFVYSPWFRVFAGWGSSAVNAIRYYQTGRDYEIAPLAGWEQTAP